MSEPGPACLLTGSPPHPGSGTAPEDWDPQGAPFDAVVAFNSLHWIDPQLRYSKPAGLLEPGGAMAVGGCRWRAAHRNPAPLTLGAWA